MSSSHHMEWKTFIEVSLSMVYTLAKYFFEAATFKDLWHVSFHTE